MKCQIPGCLEKPGEKEEEEEEELPSFSLPVKHVMLQNKK